jgi:hypothetical protein
MHNKQSHILPIMYVWLIICQTPYPVVLQYSIWLLIIKNYSLDILMLQKCSIDLYINLNMSLNIAGKGQ